MIKEPRVKCIFEISVADLEKLREIAKEKFDNNLSYLLRNLVRTAIEDHHKNKRGP